MVGHEETLLRSDTGSSSYRSVPGAYPDERRRARATQTESEDFRRFGLLQIVEDALDVFVLLERIDELEHLGRLIFRELRQILRDEFAFR